MDIQLILSLILVLCAGLYIWRRIVSLIHTSDEDSECGECSFKQGTEETNK